ncbi:mannosyltransferase [Gramella lutea]|uniref:Mannosyltransferase n=1 Tax=Christiangramia lutea TaxID=1607951 RepID=A0A9X1V0N9_9FLAO|nr:mannosyltransferase [Christiangramia lutea]MCH4822127.1 mannosyltransferase [Christiangramia lutea]
MDLRTLKLYKFPILMALSCAAFYFAFAYDLNRSDFFKLIGLYGALFFLSFKLIQQLKTKLKLLVILAVLFRLVFLFVLPNLSQDYFRFIWDGRLIAEGWNPYQYIPNDLIQLQTFNISQAKELIQGMGSLSAGHYSNYPPLNQLIFAIAGWISTSSILGSVIIFKLIIILADIGTFILGRKLLKSIGLPEHRIFWYILNPFIIIEMTGNLHFESVMVFLLILSLYLLHQKKWIWSAIIFGLSISIKLLPLMLLPLLFRFFTSDKTSLNFLKLIAYYLIIGITVIISFLPFYSHEIFSNFMASIGLWFGKFEFNASIYYLVRWIGFQVKGYNIIETAGKVLPLITFVAILGLSLFRKKMDFKRLIENMLFAVTVYLLLSTTVHPWYLAIPLMLSLFTEFRYMIVWTAVVFISYFAYSNPEFQENLWLVALEYFIVLFYIVKELKQGPKKVTIV